MVVYILFEGIDTTGKTTQIEKLKSIYPDIVSTKEPGGTLLGEKIREILLDRDFEISTNAEFLLFLSDRAEHYEKVIKPNNDKIVISDRGFISGLAYAFTNCPSTNLEYLVGLNRFVLGGEFPKKIVFFVTNKDTLLSRINSKNHDIIESRGIEYLLKVQENMEFILNKVGLDFLKLDANLDIESLHMKIKDYIND
jgi:dTMP kinase